MELDRGDQPYGRSPKSPSVGCEHRALQLGRTRVALGRRMSGYGTRNMCGSNVVPWPDGECRPITSGRAS